MARNSLPQRLQLHPGCCDQSRALGGFALECGPICWRNQHRNRHASARRSTIASSGFDRRRLQVIETTLTDATAVAPEPTQRDGLEKRRWRVPGQGSAGRKAPSPKNRSRSLVDRGCRLAGAVRSDMVGHFRDRPVWIVQAGEVALASNLARSIQAIAGRPAVGSPDQR